MEEHHRRRPRYSGKNPRHFSQKYKELRGDEETLQKVSARGKTPAGTHRSIMVEEILSILDPQPGQVMADCTLGFGGHATEIFRKLLPNGYLIGFDSDPIELPKTIKRLENQFSAEEMQHFHGVHSNYAGICKVCGKYPELLANGFDGILADLGLSSMQIDDPSRGFSFKNLGPLDMRLNPNKGLSAREFVKRVSSEKLEKILWDFADEPRAADLAPILAGKDFETTSDFAQAILASLGEELGKEAMPRVFQAVRIAVNDEMGALEAFLAQVPSCLKPGGKIAILTFHSGEDRRVKRAFKDGFHAGIFSEISDGVIRPSSEELRENSRASSAKLRWAIRSI